MSFEKKKSIILVSVIVGVLLLALIPILIVTLMPKDGDNDTPNTGESFIGAYYLDFGVGSDCYIFSEGNKLVNKSFVEDEEKSSSYSYVIAIEDGKKVIKLTDDATGEVTTHSFEVGSWTRYSYNCSNENCTTLPKDRDGEKSENCACGVGKLSPVTLKFDIIVIDGETYFEEEYRNWWNGN
jgi:hypothetical protein